MNVAERLLGRRYPRLVAGLVFAVFLTAGYGAFLYLHLTEPLSIAPVGISTGNESDQVVRDYAIEFLQWTDGVSSSTSTTALRRIAGDPTASALRRFLGLLRVRSRDQHAVLFDAPGLSASDNAVLTVLLWEGPISREKRIYIFDLKVDWQTLPSITQDAFNSIEGSSLAIFSAMAGTLRLNVVGAPELRPSYLSWLKQQDVVMLTDGFRPEGLKALELLEKVAGARDPEIAAWLGAAITMQAIDAKSGIEKINYTEKGSASLDNIVRKAPDNITCRYIRSQTFLSLPSFFQKQQETAIKDLEQIYRWSRTGHLPTATGKDLKQVPVAVDNSYLGDVVASELKKNNLASSVRDSLKRLERNIRAEEGGT